MAAKAALEQRDKIDECHVWADKAAALASYAKQAGDNTLLNFAKRIQARAMMRCGELLQQVLVNEKGGRPPKNLDGADPVLTRTQAAGDAGLSERQRKTALRLASIPKDDFKAELRTRIKELEATLLKWVVGLLIAQTAVLIAAARFIVHG
jgi:hypothetical protein